MIKKQCRQSGGLMIVTDTHEDDADVDLPAPHWSGHSTLHLKQLLPFSTVILTVVQSYGAPSIWVLLLMFLAYKVCTSLENVY